MITRWQDESWDAPTQAPVGFAMPPDGTIGDIVYRAPDLTATPSGPAPTDMTVPDGSAPALDSLVPAPEPPRDPTTPFREVDTADEKPAWDPHQPLITDDSDPSDDAWPDNDEHPSFPAPTGRPVVPVAPAAPAASTATWRPPSYPPPTGPAPGIGHIARPAPVAAPPPTGNPYPPQQPYAPARPWQTAGGPTPVYRPTPPAPQSNHLDWIVLVLLAFGVLVAPLSWILFVVAFLVGIGRRSVGPITLKVYYAGTAVIIIVWLLDMISTAMYDPLFTTYNPGAIAARIFCAVAIIVALAEYFWDRNRPAQRR